eukprot:TRINITY_DN9438_c0_g1_i1.p1 TRINITY_DN9438_c0_g1~~TRINITY_DN9438_c0_g1_i1.p1  ORF type:complete len:464 (+),score=44.06 TRINITY_DN9438_c0_g1_i1:67-1458(+)
MEENSPLARQHVKSADAEPAATPALPEMANDLSDDAPPAKPTAADCCYEKPEGGQHVKPSMREQAFWFLLGTGCTWFLGDAVFLQTAWWVDSQPEGTKIGAAMAFVSALSPVSVLVCVLLRTYAPRCFLSLVVPTTIAMSLLSGYMLGAGLWSVSSLFIYASVFIGQSVGTLVPFGVVVWIIQNGFNPALISSLYFGGSSCALSASILSWVQQPGGERLFSPSVFFLIITTPVLGSAFAYAFIRRNRIGAVMVMTDRTKNEGPSSFLQMLLKNISEWWFSALLLGLIWAVMAVGSWVVLRAVLPYAAANTVIGHTACTPDCKEVCNSLATAATCNAMSACKWSADQCIVDKGANYLQWVQSLAQWACAAGMGCTVLMPTMRLWIFPLLWVLPMCIICAMAFATTDFWEFPAAGVLLIVLTCLARFFAAYFEAMQFRYIAIRHCLLSNDLADKWKQESVLPACI